MHCQCRQERFGYRARSEMFVLGHNGTDRCSHGLAAGRFTLTLPTSVRSFVRIRSVVFCCVRKLRP